MQTMSRCTHSVRIKKQKQNRSLSFRSFEASSTFALNYTDPHIRVKSRLFHAHLILIFQLISYHFPVAYKYPKQISQVKKNDCCVLITSYFIIIGVDL